MLLGFDGCPLLGIIIMAYQRAPQQYPEMADFSGFLRQHNSAPAESMSARGRRARCYFLVSQAGFLLGSLIT